MPIANQGDIEECGGSLVIKCPLHGYRIALHTGQHITPSGLSDVKQRTHEIRKDDFGFLHIRLNLEAQEIASDIYNCNDENALPSFSNATSDFGIPQKLGTDPLGERQINVMQLNERQLSSVGMRIRKRMAIAAVQKKNGMVRVSAPQSIFGTSELESVNSDSSEYLTSQTTPFSSPTPTLSPIAKSPNNKNTTPGRSFAKRKTPASRTPKAKRLILGQEKQTTLLDHFHLTNSLEFEYAL